LKQEQEQQQQQHQQKPYVLGLMRDSKNKRVVMEL
jgi:hypothetical protein